MIVGLLVVLIVATLFTGGRIMSALDDLKTAMAQLSSDVTDYVTTVQAEFKTLADQIAALQAGGTGATDAQLQDLSAQVATVDAAVKAAPKTP